MIRACFVQAAFQRLRSVTRLVTRWHSFAGCRRFGSAHLCFGRKAAAEADIPSEWAMRGFDIFVSLVAIILFLPLMIAVFLLVMATSSGPGLFCQQRVGRDGRLFPCLKFRTMVTDAQQQLERLLAAVAAQTSVDARRLAELRTGHPAPLRLVHVVPDAGDQELALHARLSQFRLSGEWFEGIPEIYEWFEVSAL